MEPGIQRKILLDVTDLLDWLAVHVHPSGIQRVEVELVAALFAKPGRAFHYTAVFRPEDSTEILEIPSKFLTSLIDHLRSGRVSRAKVSAMLAWLTDHPRRIDVEEGDVLFLLGAFWNIPQTAQLVEYFASKGTSVAALIYDLIPVRTPEYVDGKLSREHSRVLREIGPFLSFALTISDHVARDYQAYRREMGERDIPTRAVPLAVDASGKVVNPQPDPEILRCVGDSFALQVGTIEIRKNPRYALEIWRRLIAEGETDLPKLVFFGRVGWRVADFMGELEASNYLNGRVLVISGGSDADLEALYSRAHFTLFPSFIEGWGLPVGESLARGVPCITSDASPFDEVGGEFADYVDPYNVRSGMAAVRRLLNADYRNSRARWIADHFPAKSWAAVGDEFDKQVAKALADSTIRTCSLPPFPPGQILRFGGSRKASFVRLLGWLEPDSFAIRTVKQKARIAFTSSSPGKTRIFMLVRASSSSICVTSLDGDRLLDRKVPRADTSFLIDFDTEPAVDNVVELILATSHQRTDSLAAASPGEIALEAFAYSPADDRDMRYGLLERLASRSFDVTEQGVSR